MNENTNKGLYKRNELGMTIGLRTEEMNKLAINYQINWMQNIKGLIQAYIGLNRRKWVNTKNFIFYKILKLIYSYSD